MLLKEEDKAWYNAPLWMQRLEGKKWRMAFRISIMIAVCAGSFLGWFIGELFQ